MGVVYQSFLSLSIFFKKRTKLIKNEWLIDKTGAFILGFSILT
jgi:hypothetical protein